jgi:uncharacterized membrane protein YtjA (UPF0391 family)
MFIGGILGIFGISGDRFWAQIVLLLFGTLFLISGLYAADGLNRKR